MSRIGATSSSRRCWTMCIVRRSSASASIGDMSARASTAIPASQRRRRPTDGACGSPAARTRRQRMTYRTRARPSVRIAPGSIVHVAAASVGICRWIVATPSHFRNRRVLFCAPGPATLSPVPAPSLSAPLRELAALLAPPACVACRAPQPGADDLLCAACRRALPWLPVRRCPRCALPAPCRRCPAARAPWAAAWAAMAHAGPARDLVHALKFRGAVPVADVMAAPLAAGAPARLREEDVGRVPVPAAPVRRRGRGGGHPGLLAAALGRRTGVRVVPCLVQRRTAPRQVGATRADRLRDGGPELAVAGPAPARAVLVDDVHTTGATLARAGRALRSAGTSDIRALTYARTLR